jgi:hypothetical protein
MNFQKLNSGCLGIIFSFQVFLCFAQEPEWELSEGDVGVGTGTPAVKLHLLGDSVSGVEELLRLESFASPQQVFINSDTSAKWYFAMTGDDSFKVSFDGTGRVEARFLQNGNLIVAGALTQNSDRNNKRNFEQVDVSEVLESVIELPISIWEYKEDQGVRHIGPMAQDFYAAFGVGRTPTGLSSIDTGGVALAAIQGLYSQLEKAQEENIELRMELARQEARLAKLEAVLGERQQEAR